MTNLKSSIKANTDGSFYALVVRVEDGEQIVLRGYTGRHFKSEKAAQKSCDKYISKIGG